jgi:hypothetical protein
VKTPVIYLAGGMHSGWQERVKESNKNFLYFDPCTHGLEKPSLYTAWDVTAVKGCDIILGYMEKDNPSGLGLATEIGIAHGLDKYIIIIDEKHDRYFQFAGQLADELYHDFDIFIENHHLQRIYENRLWK